MLFLDALCISKSLEWLIYYVINWLFDHSFISMEGCLWSSWKLFEGSCVRKPLEIYQIHHVCHKNHTNLIGQAWQLASVSASFNTNVNFTSKHPKGRCEPWFRDWLDTGWVTWFCANPSKPVYRSYSDPTCTCVQRPLVCKKCKSPVFIIHYENWFFIRSLRLVGWQMSIKETRI